MIGRPFFQALFGDEVHTDLDDALSAGCGTVTKIQGGTMGIPREENAEAAGGSHQNALVGNVFQKGDVVLGVSFPDGLGAQIGGDADLFAAFRPVCTGFESPVSCIKLGLVIYFTYGNIYVSMLFSQIIPHSPSPTEPKSLFFISISLAVSHNN